MGAGLQVWDASGNLIFDTPDRMGRIVGSVATTAPGSITFTVPAGCTPFWFACAPPNPNGMGNVTYSGGKITWSGASIGTLFYGYY